MKLVGGRPDDGSGPLHPVHAGGGSARLPGAADFLLHPIQLAHGVPELGAYAQDEVEVLVGHATLRP